MRMKLLSLLFYSEELLFLYVCLNVENFCEDVVNVVVVNVVV